MGSFADKRKQAEAQGLLGQGDYLKLKEGDNRMRLVSDCEPHPGEYQGKPNFKWLCYVIDRRDGKVKPFFMPHVIYKTIEALQGNDDYGFESVPMPYDITIAAIGAGTKEVKYTVLPARKETPLSDAERNDIAAQKPIAELEKLLRAKNADKQPNDAQAGDYKDDYDDHN